jgi:hypothetical protein
MKTFAQILNEKDEDWQYSVNDYYLTLDISKSRFKDLINEFIYKLPKKHSNKKKVLADIRSDGIKMSPKKVNDYIDSLDESRLEELVGFMYDAIDKWDGLTR